MYGWGKVLVNLKRSSLRCNSLVVELGFKAQYLTSLHPSSGPSLGFWDLIDPSRVPNWLSSCCNWVFPVTKFLRWDLPRQNVRGFSSLTAGFCAVAVGRCQDFELYYVPLACVYVILDPLIYFSIEHIPLHHLILRETKCFWQRCHFSKLQQGSAGCPAGDIAQWGRACLVCVKLRGNPRTERRSQNLR